MPTVNTRRIRTWYLRKCASNSVPDRNLVRSRKVGDVAMVF